MPIPFTVAGDGGRPKSFPILLPCPPNRARRFGRTSFEGRPRLGEAEPFRIDARVRPRADSWRGRIGQFAGACWQTYAVARPPRLCVRPDISFPRPDGRPGNHDENDVGTNCWTTTSSMGTRRPSARPSGTTTICLHRGRIRAPSMRSSCSGAADERRHIPQRRLGAPRHAIVAVDASTAPGQRSHEPRWGGSVWACFSRNVSCCGTRRQYIRVEASRRIVRLLQQDLRRATTRIRRQLENVQQPCRKHTWSRRTGPSVCRRPACRELARLRAHRGLRRATAGAP